MIWFFIFGFIYVLVLTIILKDYIRSRKEKKIYKEKLNNWKVNIKEKETNFRNTKFKTHEEYLYTKWDLDSLKQNKPHYEESFSLFFAFTATVCTFVIFLFVFYVVNVLSGSVIFDFGKDAVTEEYTSSWTIVAMQDNVETNGRTYLTGGYINSDLYYRYFYPAKNSGFKAGKIPADRTTIQYSDSNFRIEKHDYKWNKETEKWIKLFTIFDADSYSINDYYYVVYVPYGSIAQDYNFDLQ